MGRKSKKQQKKKHVPMRMCIVTKERHPKSELMRLVRIDGKVYVDPKGKKRGRGANITMDIDIFDEALRKGLVQRALKLERKLTDVEKKKLRDDFREAVERKKFRNGKKAVVFRVSKEEVEKIENAD